MNAGQVLTSLRRRAGLSLREMARRCGTSHSTLVSYERGRVNPGVDTLDRLTRAAGFDVTVESTRRIGTGDAARGRELADVLDVAAEFPTRHARTLTAPVFGR